MTQIVSGGRKRKRTYLKLAAREAQFNLASPKKLKIIRVFNGDDTRGRTWIGGIACFGTRWRPEIVAPLSLKTHPFPLRLTVIGGLSFQKPSGLPHRKSVG
jgi:hypothetical protein